MLAKHNREELLYLLEKNNREEHENEVYLDANCMSNEFWYLQRKSEFEKQKIIPSYHHSGWSYEFLDFSNPEPNPNFCRRATATDTVYNLRLSTLLLTSLVV